MTGKPIPAATAKASSRVRAKPLSGTRRPIRFMASRNFSRSSALWMTSREAPIISTPYRASTPLSATATAVLRPVCPPSVGRSASGRSRAMTRATASGVMGST